MPYRRQAEVPRDLTGQFVELHQRHLEGLAQLAKQWRRLSRIWALIAALWALQAAFWISRLVWGN